jgi:glycosyltransferase involved in cell wall biosynthesis
MQKQKLLRITTVPISLKYLLKGQLLFMQQQGFEVLAVSGEGDEVEDVIKQEQVRHLVVSMTRTISPIKDFISLINLLRVILAFRPSIVHTHTPKAGLLGMVAGFICRVPHRMHTVAGLPLMEAKGLRRKILVCTEWLTYRCASKVYPNSVGLKNFIQKNIKVPNRKIKIIGKGSSNGIDTQYFSRTKQIEFQSHIIRQRYDISDRNITFCFVGRVVKDKGIEELLVAFDRICKHFPAKLLLVGHFEDHLDPITTKSKELLKSNSNILHVGFQNDVRPYLVASDVFVFPSYREGFPNVVMQACCLEVPCIVSDINGCNEIIEHERTGLIVKPKDSDDLYKAMSVMAKDREKRKEFANLSKEFVQANFDQQYFWNELLMEYQNN